MPRPRARLDHAAIARAFAPDGLHGARAADLARSAGVAKPTLYAHGQSKDALFLACVQAEVERLIAELSDAELTTREMLAPQRVSALIRAVLAHADAHPAGARLLHLTARHASSTVAEDVDAALARIPARVADALRHDLAHDTTGQLASAVATALVGAAGALAIARDLDASWSAQLIGDAFAAVLAAAGPSETDEHVTVVGLY
ncbi:MAG: TetR/AcrR family transcriptional regulator [Actinomycetota bacterium]|nr:TetR/AcrR family transcriptional regulator [Actinomycetota bacterium]